VDLGQLMGLELCADAGTDVGEVKTGLGSEVLEIGLENTELAGQLDESHDFHTRPLNLFLRRHFQVVGHANIPFGIARSRSIARFMNS
jgi:hypothetical protein